MKTRIAMQIVLILLSVFLLFPVFSPFSAAAALTEAQQNSVVSFTERFLDEGNNRHLLVYGNYQNFKTIQLQLVNIQSVYSGNTKILWMMKNGGYGDYSAYAADLGLCIPGDYLPISCVGFVDLMLKCTLGLRLEYQAEGISHVSNWESYMFADNPRVTSFDGSSAVDLFEVVFDKDYGNRKTAMGVINPSILLPGDIIVGRCDAENYGHVMLSGGGDVVYQASMVPVVGKDGSYDEFLVRKDSLKKCSTQSYTRLTVYRISDGVLDPSFEGFEKQIDFGSLSTEKSLFDTQAPVIVDSVLPTASFSGRYLTKIYASDEFGEGSVTTLANDPSVVVRGNGYGQSGVFGFLYSDSPDTPGLQDKNRILGRTNLLEQAMAEGVHYLWVRDAAGNISSRYRVKLGSDKVHSLKSWTDESIQPYVIGVRFAERYLENLGIGD